MTVHVPGLEEIAAVFCCYQIDSGPFSKRYDAGNDGNSTNSRSIIQAVFPDIGSRRGIDCPQSSLATLPLDGGISAANIEHLTIPCAGRNRPLTALRAGAAYCDLVLPDWAFGDVRAVKGIINAILIADTHQLMH